MHTLQEETPLTKHMTLFTSTQDGEYKLINLAFSKKKAGHCKEWLQQLTVHPHIHVAVHYYCNSLFITHCSLAPTSIMTWMRFCIPISSTRIHSFLHG